MKTLKELTWEHHKEAERQHFVKVLEKYFQKLTGQFLIQQDIEGQMKLMEKIIISYQKIYLINT